MASKAQIDWWLEERAARERGFRVVAGIDEAGRGPLAGPVVAACVVLPFEETLDGVRDSKTLTPEQRDASFEVVKNRAEAIGIGIVDAPEIDKLNILRATHEAMRRAVAALATTPEFVLIDGLPVQPFPVLQRALVKGDGRSASIAAASIIAKVTRDRLMHDYDSIYPAYGFSRHKGYPTSEHVSLLTEHGPCPIHRRSFAPVAALVVTSEPDVTSSMSLSLFETTTKEVGDSGEIVACAHLRRLGWEILTTRYRCREGEIDIIARDQQSIVFVEVKARRGRGKPSEAVNQPKRMRTVSAANAWLYEKEHADVDCRFDVLEVNFGSDGNAKISLLKAAYMAGE
jgi:ribonuclease HII